MTIFDHVAAEMKKRGQKFIRSTPEAFALMKENDWKTDWTGTAIDEHAVTEEFLVHVSDYDGTHSLTIIPRMAVLNYAEEKL